MRWARVGLLGALLVIVLVLAPPAGLDVLLLLAVCAIPDRALQRLLPKSLRQQPRVIQADSGDT